MNIYYVEDRFFIEVGGNNVFEQSVDVVQIRIRFDI